MNRLKTMVLLATLTALLLWAGQALAGQGGMLMALLVAGLMNFGAYWWSDRIVLRLYGAQEVSEEGVADAMIEAGDACVHRGRHTTPRW